MRKNTLPDYPRIALSELSQFRVDAESARQFERRFHPGLLGGMALAFGGPGVGGVLHYFALVDGLVVGLGSTCSIILGLGISLGTHHCMMRARPRSLPSGHTTVVASAVGASLLV
ncbi:MAG: hypothetical protein EOP84_03935, partial [Verrucomicrobiaceae bacterium]